MCRNAGANTCRHFKYNNVGILCRNSKYIEVKHRCEVNENVLFDIFFTEHEPKARNLRLK